MVVLRCPTASSTHAHPPAARPPAGVAGPYTRAKDPFVLYDLSQPSPVRDYARRFYNATAQAGRGRACWVLARISAGVCQQLEWRSRPIYVHHDSRRVLVARRHSSRFTSLPQPRPLCPPFSCQCQCPYPPCTLRLLRSPCSTSWRAAAPTRTRSQQSTSSTCPHGMFRCEFFRGRSARICAGWQLSAGWLQERNC